MSATTATTLILKPKAVAPQGLIEAIEKTGVIEWNYSAANGDFVEFQTLDSTVILGSTLANMRKPETYLDDLLVVQFIHGTKEVHADDHQPFEIIKDGEGPQIVVFAEGDFPTYEDPDKIHSNEYYLVQEFLSEEIKKVYQENGEDLAKTMAALGDEKYRTKMLDHVAPRGVVTILSGDGSDPVTYAKNEQGLQADWGYVSRTHGWSAAEKVAEATSTKPLTRLERLNAAKATTTTTPPAETTKPTTSVPPVSPKPAETSTKIPDNAGVQVIKIPANLRGKHLRKWHEKHFGKTNVPAEVDWYKPRPVSELLPTSHLARLNNLGDLSKVAHQPTPTATSNPSKGIAEAPPIIPPQMKKTLMDRIKKGEISLYSPDKIPDVEKEFPTFGDQIEEPLEKLVLWVNRDLRNLSQTELMCYANTMRHELIKARPELLKTEKKEAVSTAETKPLTRMERLALAQKKAA